MQPDQMSTPPSGEGAERLASSARGWHSIQLAVLGFIGICGVLRTGSDSNGPQWVRWLSAGLALFAFALACLAIYQVGRVAYPFYGAPAPTSPGSDGLASSTRQLRTGVRMTYVAVGCLALAAISGWWPGADGAAGGGSAGALVQVSGATGESACGTLLEGGPGTLRLDTAQGTVSVRLVSVLTIEPVSSC